VTDFSSPTEKVKKALTELTDFHKINSLESKERYDAAYKKYLEKFEEKAKYLQKKDPGLVLQPKAYKDDWAHLLVYAHNFSNFDGVFLVNHLVSFFDSKKVKIIWDKDGRFISIKVGFTINITDDKGKRSKKTLTITFLDSFRLLPASLLKLTKSFSYNDTSLEKTSFDHSKMNRFTIYDYKDEAIKYCLQDCCHSKYLLM
jgi:hypothetical protein